MSTSSISSLDWDTILEYNLPNAFAVPVSEVEDTTPYQYKSVTTDSYSQSAGLLSSITTKLETIKTNLQLMQNYALEGYQSTYNDSDTRAEAYANLRSLSAGIDTIVRDYQLEDIPLFNGRNFELSYGSGSLSMNLDNLSSSDEEGLGLASSPEGAFATISYDYLAYTKNASSDIVGLDITDATATEVDLEAYPYSGELEDGDYWLKVTYMGEQSTLEIQNMDGTTIEKIENVDLTGTGEVTAKSNVGVAITFSKDYFETALGNDKHDWEELGAQSLYANLHYESNVRHVLDDGSDTELNEEDDVSITRGSTIIGNTSGSLSVEASTAPVYEGVTTMDTGQYDLKIKYDGEDSSLWLYDNTGNLISTRRNVDLTGEDAVSVDMGTGVSISLDPDNFSSTKRDYHVYLDYTAADEASEELDYGEYYDRIIDAIAVIDENLAAVEQAQETLETQYSIVQSALKIATTGGASISGSLGSSSIDASSLFGAINSSSSDNSSVLSASGSILGTLQTAAGSLSDVDASVLALYY